VSNDLTLGDSALRYVERCHCVARRLKAHSPASPVTTAEAPAKATEFGVVRNLLLRAKSSHLTSTAIVSVARAVLRRRSEGIEDGK
jgi:hypothetical protein